jgi:hypothetical protein
VGPLLFQDLVGGAQDIFIQHVDGQWRAFSAHAPGAPRRCQLTWRPATGDFVDKCSQDTYPADGSGLTLYRTVVDAKGKLVVDLNAPVDAGPLVPPAPVALAPS